ncbi:MAG: hypothetical protein U0263_41580 [Polyangiaceae bacterium]
MRSTAFLIAVCVVACSSTSTNPEVGSSGSGAASASGGTAGSGATGGSGGTGRRRDRW